MDLFDFFISIFSMVIFSSFGGLVEAQLPTPLYSPHVVVEGWAIFSTAYDAMSDTMYFGTNCAVQYFPLASHLPLDSGGGAWYGVPVAGHTTTDGPISFDEVFSYEAYFHRVFGLVGITASDALDSISAWSEGSGGETTIIRSRHRGAAVNETWVGLIATEVSGNCIRLINFIRNNNVTLLAGNGAVSADDGIGRNATVGQPSWIVRLHVPHPVAPAVVLGVAWIGQDVCIRYGYAVTGSITTSSDGSSSATATTTINLQNMVLNVSLFAGLCAPIQSTTTYGLVYNRSIFNSVSGMAIIRPFSQAPDMMAVTDKRAMIIAPLWPQESRYLTLMTDLAPDPGLWGHGIAVPVLSPGSSVGSVAMIQYLVVVDPIAYNATATLSLQPNGTVRMESAMSQFMINPGFPSVTQLVLVPRASSSSTTPNSDGGGTTMLVFVGLRNQYVVVACCLGANYFRRPPQQTWTRRLTATPQATPSSTHGMGTSTKTLRSVSHTHPHGHEAWNRSDSRKGSFSRSVSVSTSRGSKSLSLFNVPVAIRPSPAIAWVSMTSVVVGMFTAGSALPVVLQAANLLMSVDCTSASSPSLPASGSTVAWTAAVPFRIGAANDEIGGLSALLCVIVVSVVLHVVVTRMVFLWLRKKRRGGQSTEEEGAEDGGDIDGTGLHHAHGVINDDHDHEDGHRHHDYRNGGDGGGLLIDRWSAMAATRFPSLTLRVWSYCLIGVLYEVVRLHFYGVERLHGAYAIVVISLIWASCLVLVMVVAGIWSWRGRCGVNRRRPREETVEDASVSERTPWRSVPAPRIRSSAQPEERRAEEHGQVNRDRNLTMAATLASPAQGSDHRGNHHHHQRLEQQNNRNNNNEFLDPGDDVLPARNRVIYVPALDCSAGVSNDPPTRGGTPTNGVAFANAHPMDAYVNKSSADCSSARAAAAPPPPTPPAATVTGRVVIPATTVAPAATIRHAAVDFGRRNDTVSTAVRSTGLTATTTTTTTTTSADDDRPFTEPLRRVDPSVVTSSPPPSFTPSLLQPLAMYCCRDDIRRQCGVETRSPDRDDDDDQEEEEEGFVVITKKQLGVLRASLKLYTPYDASLWEMMMVPWWLQWTLPEGRWRRMGSPQWLNTLWASVYAPLREPAPQYGGTMIPYAFAVMVTVVLGTIQHQQLQLSSSMSNTTSILACQASMNTLGILVLIFAILIFVGRPYRFALDNVSVSMTLVAMSSVVFIIAQPGPDMNMNASTLSTKNSLLILTVVLGAISVGLSLVHCVVEWRWIAPRQRELEWATAESVWNGLTSAQKRRIGRKEGIRGDHHEVADHHGDAWSSINTTDSGYEAPLLH